MNKETRFAQNPAFIFAAIALIEKRQVQRNLGISFNRGTAKKKTQMEILSIPWLDMGKLSIGIGEFCAG